MKSLRKMPVGSWDHILSSKNTKLRFGNSTWEQIHDQLRRREIHPSIAMKTRRHLGPIRLQKPQLRVAIHQNVISQCRRALEWSNTDSFQCLDEVRSSKWESKRTSKHQNLAVFILICDYNDVLWCLGVLEPIANPKRSHSITNKRDLDVPA